ncbi:MAG: type III secretion system chaperone [Pseudomonadota bacterium]
MLNYEDVSNMLSEVGPKLDVVEISGIEEDDAWFVVLDEDGDYGVELYHDGTNGKLVFSAEIGSPPEDVLHSVCMDMLALNLGWQDTAGARIARDPDSGEFVLLQDVVLYELTSVDLQNAIASFAQAAVGLRALVATGRSESDDEETQSSAVSDEDGPPIIRV